MERTVLRILGKKGRTTIPWPIRAELDFCPGDVLCSSLTHLTG